MIYWGALIYMGITVLLWMANPWVGGVWSLITGGGFYALVVWDERDRRKRGEIK